MKVIPTRTIDRMPLCTSAVTFLQQFPTGTLISKPAQMDPNSTYQHNSDFDCEAQVSASLLPDSQRSFVDHDAFANAQEDSFLIDPFEFSKLLGINELVGLEEEQQQNNTSKNKDSSAYSVVPQDSNNTVEGSNNLSKDCAEQNNQQHNFLDVFNIIEDHPDGPELFQDEPAQTIQDVFSLEPQNLDIACPSPLVNNAPVGSFEPCWDDDTGGEIPSSACEEGEHLALSAHQDCWNTLVAETLLLLVSDDQNDHILGDENGSKEKDDKQQFNICNNSGAVYQSSTKTDPPGTDDRCKIFGTHEEEEGVGVNSAANTKVTTSRRNFIDGDLGIKESRILDNSTKKSDDFVKKPPAISIPNIKAAPLVESPQSTPSLLKKRKSPGNRPTSSRTAERVIKGCSCKKSRCLKKYCECFSEGNYCINGECYCTACCNNPSFELERQKAIATALERNPLAFCPSISPRNAKRRRASRRSNNGGQISQHGITPTLANSSKGDIGLAPPGRSLPQRVPLLAPSLLWPPKRASTLTPTAHPFLDSTPVVVRPGRKDKAVPVPHPFLDS